MKRILATIILFMPLLAVGACKTTAPTPTDDPDVVEKPRRTSDSSPEEAAPPSPFEVAEAWIDRPTPTSDAVESVTSTWETPWVERMHAQGPRYRALILGGEAPEEAVLLTLEQADDTWSVVAVEVVPADYLWPTK